MPLLPCIGSLLEDRFSEGHFPKSRARRKDPTPVKDRNAVTECQTRPWCARLWNNLIFIPEPQCEFRSPQRHADMDRLALLPGCPSPGEPTPIALHSSGVIACGLGASVAVYDVSGDQTCDWWEVQRPMECRDGKFDDSSLAQNMILHSLNS